MIRGSPRDQWLAARRELLAQEPHLPHFLLLRARIDLLNRTYNWLDLTALGRQEPDVIGDAGTPE